jgi:enoyl-CoA hydratase/carnithine racemase
VAYKELIYSVEDEVVTITLNRPERMNAISHVLQDEVHAAFDEADADRAVRVIILTGAGKAFCTGFDQGANKDGKKNSDPTGKSIAEFVEFCQKRQGRRIADWEHMWRLGKPIIAAVNGWAMGAGFWYQLAADITIASDQAVFAQPEVRHISSSSYLLTALCGWKVANRWALTGDHFDAAEALRIGMVNEVVPHDKLMERTLELAHRIAKVPEPSVRLNKAVAMQGIQAAGLHAALLTEGLLGTMAQVSHNEYREKLFEVQRTKGTRAYLEMRDGPFQPEPMGPRSKPRKKAE